MVRGTPACIAVLVASLIPGIVLGVAGCAVPVTAPSPMAADPLVDEEDEVGPGGFPDPFEPLNRATVAFNRQFDRFVFAPITRIYRFVLPAPARRAVRRALVNLDAPVTFANDVLQLERRDAAVTAARFVINTTVGIAGLFDVAGEVAGISGHETDFGQTLALAGVSSGPYLIVPLLGPNNARDAAGYVVDFLFRPTTYLVTPAGQVIVLGLANPGGQLLFTVIFEGGTELAHGLTRRESVGESLVALEASSLDYYAALRSAYYQERTAFIRGRWPHRGHFAHGKQAVAAWSLAPTRGPVQVGDINVRR
jgi:phospholipid-binding lipoprotein MlaA